MTRNEGMRANEAGTSGPYWSDGEEEQVKSQPKLEWARLQSPQMERKDQDGERKKVSTCMGEGKHIRKYVASGRAPVNKASQGVRLRLSIIGL